MQRRRVKRHSGVSVWQCHIVLAVLTAVLIVVVVSTRTWQPVLFTAIFKALHSKNEATVPCGRQPWANGRIGDSDAHALFLVDAYVVAEAALGPAALRNLRFARAATMARKGEPLRAPRLVSFLFTSLDRIYLPALGKTAFRTRYNRAAHAVWKCRHSDDTVECAAAVPDKGRHTLTVVCVAPPTWEEAVLGNGSTDVLSTLQVPIDIQQTTLSIVARDADGDVLRYENIAPCLDGVLIPSRVQGGLLGGLFGTVTGAAVGAVRQSIALALCTSVDSLRATPAALLPWVLYHRAVGFDAVAVYVNAPNADELIRALERSTLGHMLIDSGGLVLIAWNFFEGHPRVPFSDQGASLAHCLEHARGTVEWLAFADVDEYFDAPNSTPNSTDDPVVAHTLHTLLASERFQMAHVLRVKSQHWGSHEAPNAAQEYRRTQLLRSGSVGTLGDLPDRQRAPWTGCHTKLRGYIMKGQEKVILRPAMVDYVSVHRATVCGASGGGCKPTDVDPSVLRLNHLKPAAWPIHPCCTQCGRLHMCSPGSCGKTLKALAATARVKFADRFEHDTSFAWRADDAVARLRAQMHV